MDMTSKFPIQICYGETIKVHSATNVPIECPVCRVQLERVELDVSIYINFGAAKRVRIYCPLDRSPECRTVFADYVFTKKKYKNYLKRLKKQEVPLIDKKAF